MRIAGVVGAFALGLLATAAHPVHGDEYRVGDLAIDNVWARASIGSAGNGVAYMTIRNNGREADRLLAVHARLAKKVELHIHTEVKGVLKMRRADAIDVPAGATLVVEPEGTVSIMLLGLNAPLREGDGFPATLEFEKAGRVEVTMPVRKSPAAGRPKPGN